MKYHYILLPLATMFCAAVFAGGASVSAQTSEAEAPVATATVSTVTPSHTPNSWEQSEDSTWRYYDASGIGVTGEVTVDGQAYLFGADGALCTGWQTVNGVRRYYDPFTAQPRTEWIFHQQAYYYVDAENGKYSGIQYGLTALNGASTKPTAKFLFDSYGVLQLGYVTYTDGFRYYVDEKTGVVVTGDIRIDDKWYRFGTDGRQTTGWVTIQSNRYYFDPKTGESLTGIVKIGNNSYYITADGGMQTGYQTIGNQAYYFKDNGIMLQNESVTINGVQYQANAKGVLQQVPEKQSTSGPTRVMGTAQATSAQMQAYIRSVNPNVAQSVIDMIPYYLSEGAAEGVRGDIAFAQSCLETGNFTFSGSAVTLGQNNFCGMGVTSNGVKGNSFSTAQIGIRAQIQHLKAYASTDPLSQTCVDPRFQYVTRGCAVYVEWLGIQENPKGYGWAAGANYGDNILRILRSILKM